MQKGVSPYLGGGFVTLSGSTSSGPFDSDSNSEIYWYISPGFEYRSEGGFLARGSVYALIANLDSSLSASGTYFYRLRQVDLNSTVHYTQSISIEYIVSDVLEGPEEIPKEFCVYQNYPNPFNPSTTIAYHLPANAYVSLKLYDLLGREVMTVVDAFEPAGRKSVTVDATNLASGAYFYRLVAGDRTQTRKLLLLR